MFRKLIELLFPKKANDEANNNRDEIQDLLGNLFRTGEIITTIEVVNLQDILTLLQRDFSKVGYDSALRLADRKHAENILDAIKGKLLNYIRKVEEIQNEEKNRLELNMNMYEHQGYLDLMKREKSLLDNLKREMEQLQEVKKQVEQETENGVFHHVKKSFFVGFERGMIYVATVGNHHPTSTNEQNNLNQ